MEFLSKEQILKALEAVDSQEIISHYNTREKLPDMEAITLSEGWFKVVAPLVKGIPQSVKEKIEKAGLKSEVIACLTSTAIYAYLIGLMSPVEVEPDPDQEPPEQEIKEPEEAGEACGTGT